MKEVQRDRDISFFKPRGATMTGETRVIKLVLTGWLLAIAGFQGIIYLTAHSPQWSHLLNWTVFNLPVHFWLTGHFLPLWFIIMCGLFNLWMDRHAARSLDGSLRFRIRPQDGEE